MWVTESVIGLLGKLTLFILNTPSINKEIILKITKIKCMYTDHNVFLEPLHVKQNWQSPFKTKIVALTKIKICKG